MKKPYLRAVIGSSGRGCVLIILFPLYSSKGGFLNVIYSEWLSSMAPNLFIGRKTSRMLKVQSCKLEKH